MPSIETRPYKTAHKSSVDTNISIISPELNQLALSDVWQTGQDITIQFEATVRESFWQETQVALDTEVILVGLVSCPVARKRWDVRKAFTFVDINMPMTLQLVVPGNEIAHELRVDFWVVGPGVVGSGAVHAGAKLWELHESPFYQLESGNQAFPTSAISFAESGRPALPWVVEIDYDATPEWKIQSCLRLYVNTDSPISQDILDEKAHADVYTHITHDIYFSAIQSIAQWVGQDGYHLDDLEQIAEEDYESLAALAITASEKIGASLGNTISRIHENPYSLLLSFREAFPLYQEIK